MVSKVMDIQDFSIVVVADNHSPSILNPDFLKYNRIVPDDWELAMPPICTPSVSQVAYKNGVNILAQPDKVTFWEAVEQDNFSVKVAEVSGKYVETVAYFNYRAIGININGRVVADRDQEIKNFILNRLIAPGKWKSFQGNFADVAVQFAYPMGNGTLTLDVKKLLMQQPPEKEEIPILLFSANFHRDISGITSEEKISQLRNIIESWKNDVNTFKSLVEETFLVVGDEGK